MEGSATYTASLDVSPSLTGSCGVEPSKSVTGINLVVDVADLAIGSTTDAAQSTLVASASSSVTKWNTTSKEEA